jgi:hypothetical protein
MTTRPRMERYHSLQRLVRHGEYDCGAQFVGVGNPRLRAVDNPLIPVGRGGGRRGAGIAAVPGPLRPKHPILNLPVASSLPWPVHGATYCSFNLFELNALMGYRYRLLCADMMTPTLAQL